jgi:DNA primase
MVSHGSADWLNVIGGSTPAELHSLLRSIAAQALPANNDADLIRYGQGVVSRALVNALAHEKANLLAALRRTDVAEDPQESARIQRELVDLETERRKVQGL